MMRTGFPVSDEDILALKVKLLRLLAEERYPREALGLIAIKHNLSYDDARALVERHGWPEARSMGKAADALEGKLPTTPPAPSKVTANGSTKASVSLAAAPKPTPQANGTELMLAAAEKSGKTRTRGLAVKIRKDLAEIQGLVIAERKEAEAAQLKAEEMARLKDEVADLERQLAEKKAALRPGRAKPSNPKPSNPKPENNNARIRAWAAEQGITCPAYGRIPVDVVMAYQRAHATEGEA